jgi:hypothetical protein
MRVCFVTTLACLLFACAGPTPPSSFTRDAGPARDALADDDAATVVVRPVLDFDAIDVHAPAALWMRQGNTLTRDGLAGIGVDALGNVYLAGSFQGGVDFGLGPLNGPKAPSRHAVVAKIAADGTPLWNVASSQGAWGDVGLYALAVDVFGNVVIGGECVGEPDFGSGKLEAGTLAGCIASWDAFGDLRWAKTTGTRAPRSIEAMPTGGFLVGGFDYSDERGYLDVIDESGDASPFVQIRSGSSMVHSVRASPAGDVAILAQAWGVIQIDLDILSDGTRDYLGATFDPSGVLTRHWWGEIGNAVLPTGGAAFSGDAVTFAVESVPEIPKYAGWGVVVQLDALGAERWSWRWPNAEVPTTIASTSDGELLVGSNDYGARLLDFDASTGAARWTRTFATAEKDHLVGIDQVVPVRDGWIVCGSFSGTIDFGAGPYRPPEMDLDVFDVYVAKLPR